VAGAPAAAGGTPAQTLRAAEEAAVAASPNDCGRAVQELLRRTGNPDEPYRTANDFMAMVAHTGSGWRQVTQEEASRLANEGQVVIGGLAVPGGHGHILAVMPGPMRRAGGFMSNGTLIPPGDLAPPAMSGSMSNYGGAHSSGEKTTRDAWTRADYPKVTFWTRQ
jgi:hypothetical protein